MENLLDLLFKEQETGLPEINPEAKHIDSVRIIIQRDKGRPKDGEKEIARKELAFIFYMVNKSFFETYEGEARILLVKERVGLPTKWMPDELVLKAVKDLKEDNITTQDRLLASAKQNLVDSLTLFEEVRTYYRNLIGILQKDNTLDEKDLTSQELLDRNKERKEAIEAAKGYAKEMTSTIADLKKNFDLVDALELAVRAQKKKVTKKISMFETDRSLYKVDQH